MSHRDWNGRNAFSPSAQDLRQVITWLIAGRCVFGVDGSKLELARTRSNEQRFAPSRRR